MVDEAIGRLLEQLVADPLQPGAVVATLIGGELKLYAAGYMEKEHRRRMPTDALFRLSSMTKPIVAVSLLQLVQDGMLRLDDPVARWLPELASPRVLTRIGADLDEVSPAKTPITVEHLLSSRMGTGILARPPGSTPIQREIARRNLPGFGPDDPSNPIGSDDWLGQIGQLPLLAEPGTAWFYNISTIVQGILVARVTGRSLADHIGERIAGPLNMPDTGFSVPAAKLHRLTASYAGDMTTRDEAVGSEWSKPPRLEASLVSTAADYAAFVGMLHRRGAGPHGQVLDEDFVRLMLTDHLTSTQREASTAFLDGRGWGYGLSVDPAQRMDTGWAGTAGWAGGLGSSWTSRFDTDAAVIILGCRAIDNPDVYAAHVRLTDDALAASGSSTSAP